VVNALKVTLAMAQPVGAHRIAHGEAYDQYLTGKQAYNHDDYGLAVEAYRRAVALDDQFAAAYAWLAEAEGDLSDVTTGDRAGLQRGVSAAAKAIELAPDQPEGYAARGETRSLSFP
jgi:hypothetical protein